MLQGFVANLAAEQFSLLLRRFTGTGGRQFSLLSRRSDWGKGAGAWAEAQVVDEAAVVEFAPPLITAVAAVLQAGCVGVCCVVDSWVHTGIGMVVSGDSIGGTGKGGNTRGPT